MIGYCIFEASRRHCSIQHSTSWTLCLTCFKYLRLFTAEKFSRLSDTQRLEEIYQVFTAKVSRVSPQQTDAFVYYRNINNAFQTNDSSYRSILDKKELRTAFHEKKECILSRDCAPSSGNPQAIKKYSDTHPLKPVLVRIQWILIYLMDEHYPPFEKLGPGSK